MPQRCLYEVLGCERTADDDAIKKAYRKQALVWHPGGCACVLLVSYTMYSLCISSTFNQHPWQPSPRQLQQQRCCSRLVLSTPASCCSADKNQLRIDEAHAVFQEIQNAYEVLSDKHERAWWVSCRNQQLPQLHVCLQLVLATYNSLQAHSQSYIWLLAAPAYFLSLFHQQVRQPPRPDPALRRTPPGGRRLCRVCDRPAPRRRA